jgi:hypothetical protein
MGWAVKVNLLPSLESYLVYRDEVHHQACMEQVKKYVHVRKYKVAEVKVYPWYIRDKLETLDPVQ